MENVGSNEVSIFDFNVYYQNQDIIEPAKLGCLKMINQQCFFCELGWQFDIVQQDCIPICGNKIEQAYEECDDGNDIANDGCYNCKFECSLDCQDCYFGKCLVQQNSNDIEQYDTLKKIQDCQNSKGYYFDILSNDCQSICGDQIITLQEECDDGNYQFNDGCMNCKFICSDECLNCQFGKCYQCNPGYKIIQFKCIPNCGDQLIIADEKCDDGNNIPFDGCYKCQSSCQLECIICQNSYCIECLQGWNLIEGLCEQRCGDQQVALMSNEQCDDLSNNNCVDCSYSFCQINCQICNQHQCVSCIYPFQLIDGLCQPICGDSIITPEYEECDDGNDIPFDGCYQCQYSCSYGCISCTKNNICNQCDQNLFILDNFTSQCKQINSIIYNNNNEYPLIDSLYNINNTSIRCYQNYILIDNICVNQCGNGQLNSFYEECDDGNNHGGDGCSSLCQLEQSFQCINIEGQLTTCSFIKPSDFNLISLSDKANQTQIIELTFTQQVKLIYPSQLQEIIVFKISPEITHELTIIPIQNLTIDLNNPIYQIIIYFQQSIENPILEVEISKFQIFDQYDQGLLNFNKNISLGNPFVISESTKQQVVTIVKLNDAMMYSMASIAGLALLTGNMLMILNLLDLLQSLSYIRFMQYQFPPHLRLFLDTYTKVSLQPILDYFKVDEIITQLNGGLLPYKKKKSSNFNSNYALNSFYLINAKSCYFSLLASLLTYIICSAISSQIINQKLSNYYLKYQQKLKFLKLLSIFQAKVQFQCLKIKNNYFSLGIFQLYFTILHQLSFSTFIQFPDYTFQSVFEFFNSINAAIALIMILFCCLKMLSITSASIRNISKWKYFYLGSKTQFWAINFKSFQIFRIKFYIFIITLKFQL
ncbi:unnamed protein product [Paramecium sonneborni]|uniref:Transmembrane protein n=1 Tax=Paramecium sonneborni TaxID=65129 RepID=A0A8S1RCB8_9CILI|nr:unnamed protein product [Paramecium sonneborni]